MKLNITGEREKEGDSNLEYSSETDLPQPIDTPRKKYHGFQVSEKIEIVKDERGCGIGEKGSGKGRGSQAIPALRISESEYLRSSTSACATFDANFIEMEKKKIICDKKNENIIMTHSNTQIVKRVLIVDDSMLCQKIIIKVLDGANYSFETAGNGKEACDKIGKLIKF